MECYTIEFGYKHVFNSDSISPEDGKFFLIQRLNIFYLQPLIYQQYTQIRYNFY